LDETLKSWLRAPEDLGELAILYAPRVLSATVILVAGWFVARWASTFFARGLQRSPLEAPMRDLLARFARLLVFAVFLLIALQNLGIDLLPLIAGLGIAGAAVALALQGVLGNVAAGLTIIFTRPFHVGQYVAIAGVEGEVRSVSLFNTTLRHSDLSLVVIPNRKIVGEILHNYGEIRQLDLHVSVAYTVDVEVAFAAIREVLDANPRALKDPRPVLQVDRLEDQKLRIAIRPWVAVKDFGAAAGEINAAVVDALEQHGIVIPAATAIQLLRTPPTAAGRPS